MAVCASPTAVHTRKLALHDRCPVASAASHLFDAAKTMEQVHHQDLKAVKVQFKQTCRGNSPAPTRNRIRLFGAAPSPG